LLRHKVKKYLALPNPERRVLAEAVIALAGARLALVCLSFRRVSAWLGRTGGESGTSVSSIHDIAARRIGWAVETMSRHVPWESRCLAQALAAWWMLGRRGIPGTVYFGIAHNPEKPFNAHAWLRCGELLVTGGKGHERFRVMTSFAREGQ
jgi:hypothetical protein